MQNTYIVGDSRTVLSQLADESVDLVVTDPPYGIGYQRLHGLKAKRPVLVGDTAREAPWLMREVMVQVAMVMKPGATIYVFCPGGRTAFRQGSALVAELERHFDIRQTIVWDKLAIGPGCYWRTRYELAVMASKGKVATWNGGHSEANVLGCRRVRAWPTGHPTPKPIDLVGKLVEASSNLGDLVLDPFAGSGVVGAAAVRSGRRWLCIDIDQRWAAEAANRYGLLAEYFENTLCK